MFPFMGSSDATFRHRAIKHGVEFGGFIDDVVVHVEHIISFRRVIGRNHHVESVDSVFLWVRGCCAFCRVCLMVGSLWVEWVWHGVDIRAPSIGAVDPTVASPMDKIDKLVIRIVDGRRKSSGMMCGKGGDLAC